MTANRLSQPPRTPPACRIDQFAQRRSHRIFDRAGPLDVAGNAKQFGPGIVRPANRGKPRRAAPHDVRHHGNGLDVVDRGRTTIKPNVGGKRRLQPRLAFLAFEAFQQRGFLAADVGPGAVVDVEVEIPAMDVVLADQLGVVGLVDCGLQALALADEFAAHVDVAGMRAHGAAGDQATFDQEMRIVPHDLAVLAGAGLGLVSVDHEIARPAIFQFFRHKRPFKAGRKSCAATAAQARRLDFIDDRVATFFKDRLGAVPGTAGARASETPVALAIQVREDTVLVVEHRITPSPSSAWLAHRPAPRTAGRSAGPALADCQWQSRPRLFQN